MGVEESVVDFAKQLKIARKRRGMTQHELGSCLGLGQTAIANYERGIRFPDAAGLNALADTLQVSLDELLGRRQVQGLVPDTSTEDRGGQPDTQTLRQQRISA